MRYKHLFESELFEDFESYEGALVFDDWSAFMEKCNQIKQRVSIDQACELTGIGKEFFHKVVDQAFSAWRDSTTTSPLHGISHITLGQTPKIDTPIFKDLVWQTRFLTICINMFRNSFLFGTKPIIGNDKKPIMAKGTKALQAATPNIVSMSNKILRCLYLYWWLNSLKKVKLPKRIYRGIRAGNLYNHPTLEPLVSAIWASDKSHIMKRKEAVDILIKWICDRKLHQITDGDVLSFTASMPVAKYFSNGEGFVLAVDPSKVQIITSELHDERLQGKDYLSKKNEKEYIVRIPDDYAFKSEDIIINDLEYFIAEENPLAVSLFDHDDKRATYELNATIITAWFSWRTNESGGLLFQVPSRHWPYTRKEFMKELSFDPLPTDKNLSQIKNFKISSHKNY